MRRRVSALGVAMLGLAGGGCSLLVPDVPVAQPVPAHFDSREHLAQVRRILVLPFDTAAGITGDTSAVRATFVGELAKTRRFEIMPMPDGADQEAVLYQELRRGVVSARALAELGERYRIDGVLLGTVTGYRPYKPPQIGVRVQLVSLHTATAVWAAEAFYDAGDAVTISDVRHYANSVMTEPDNLHGWEMVLLSPTLFATFVAHRVVGTLERA